MAKSKNHTNHNQNSKDHRNGIKKPQKQRFASLRGVDQKFLRNQRFAKRYALKPRQQSAIDKTKFRQEKKLVKVAMIEICRQRRLANKNKDNQQKKSSEEKRKLWKEAKKAGKTRIVFEKELREKAIALLKENTAKNKAERAKAKEEKAKAKAAGTPAAAAKPAPAAEAPKKEGAKDKKVKKPLRKTQRKRQLISVRKAHDLRRRINLLALRRIKFFESKKSQKLRAFKKHDAKLKNKRVIIKTQLYNEIRDNVRIKRTRKFAVKRVRDALKKGKKRALELKAARDAGTPLPVEEKKVKKEKKVVKAKTAKAGKPGKPGKPSKKVLAARAAAKAAKPAKIVKKKSKKAVRANRLRGNKVSVPNRLTPPLKVDGKLKKTLLAEINKEKTARAVKRREKKNKGAAQKKAAAPSTEQPKQ